MKQVKRGDAPNSITLTYDLLLWTIPTLAKFPRDQRYLLGERIETGLLDVLDDLVEANYTRSKEALLKRAKHKTRPPRVGRLTLEDSGRAFIVAMLRRRPWPGCSVLPAQPRVCVQFLSNQTASSASLRPPWARVMNIR